MVDAKDVQRLRQATGAGMMDAKRALEEANGDMERAQDVLREKGLASAAKKAGRSQAEGAIGSYLHYQSGRPVIGVLVELATETDFVAKTDDFQKVANDLAMHVAAARPSWVRSDDVPEDVLAKERDVAATQARNEGKPDNVIDRIVEGKVKKFFEDEVLYDQVFVNPEVFDGTVGSWMQQLTASLGENIGVRRISRIQVGEGAE